MTTRSTRALILLLAFGFASASQAIPPGFSLENGGFEDGVKNWAWEQYKGLPEPGRLETAGSYEGRAHYRLGLPGVEGLRFVNTGTFPILPGSTYQLRIALACEDVPEHGAFVRILQYGTEKGEKNEPQGWVVAPGAKDGDLLSTGGTHGWKEWTFTIPPDRLKPSTRRLGLYVYHREIGVGSVRIDGIDFAPVAGTIPADALERLKRDATVSATRKTEAPDPAEKPQRGNLLPGDTSFETGVGVWPQTRRAEGGTHGGSSLLAPSSLMAFRGPNVYTVVRKGTNYTLSLDARSDGDLSLLVDLWNLEYRIMKRERLAVTPKWTRFTIALPPQPMVHSLYLAFTKEQPGDLQLDALQFEAGAASSYHCAEPFLADAEILGRDPGSVFLAGGARLDIGVRFYNESHPGEIFRIDAVTRDFDGKEKVRRSLSIPVPRGRSENVAVPMLESRVNGYFLCSLEVTDPAGKSVLKKEIPAVVVPPPLHPGEDPDSFFGVQGGGVAPEALARLGAKWYRSFRGWRWLEPKQGKLTLAPVQWLPWRTNGFSLMETLQVTLMPDWAKAPDGKVKDPAEVNAFALSMLERLGSNARYWEIENEPDLVFPSSAKLSTEAGAAYYAQIVRETSRAIRAASPQAKIMASGVSGGDFDGWAFSREAFRLAPNSFDIWAFHPYAPTRNLGPAGLSVSPEDNRMREKLLDAEAKVSEWGGKQRLWIGELGWAFDIKEPVSSPHAKRQAEIVARAYILARSVAAVERLFWFTLLGTLEGGYEYGIWRDERTPLPAVAAYGACARLLDHTRPVKAVYESEVRAYVFRREDGAAVAALWKHRGTPTELELALPPGRLRLTDVVGASPAAAARGDHALVPLTSAPIYLEVPGLSPEALAAAIEAGKIAMDPVTLTVSLGDSSALRAVVKNNLPRPVAGTLKLDCPPGLAAPSNSFALRLEPAGTAAFVFRLQGEASDPQAALRLTAETAEGSVGRSLPLKADACPRLTPRFGEDFGGWENAARIVLADRSFIQPPDAAVVWKDVANLEVEARFSWDDRFFYFAALVKDDVFFQEKQGASLFGGDSIQLAFDARNDGVENVSGYDDNDHEFGMALCHNGATLVRYAGPKALPMGPAVAGAKLQIVNRGKETFYQLALPWEALAPLYPAAGRRFGFNFIVNDNDGHGRKYWMGPTPGIGEGKTPGVYRKYVLR
ncbi:MAG: hypothetical protein J0L75_00580 [Spirochaetes bacterium]|nr:hypothetical protein [Spirochaetota bacterium]